MRGRECRGRGVSLQVARQRLQEKVEELEKRLARHVEDLNEREGRQPPVVRAPPPPPTTYGRGMGKTPSYSHDVRVLVPTL